MRRGAYQNDLTICHSTIAWYAQVVADKVVRVTVDDIENDIESVILFLLDLMRSREGY